MKIQTARAILGYLLATAVFVIILIALGLFDPKPVGTLQTTLPEATLSVNNPGQTIQWLPDPLPQTDFSVRGTAVWQSGSQDSGIGIALGNLEHNLVVAVSPLGYVLIQQNGEAVLPWQPWPHVQFGEMPNEIWLDVRGERVTVRLNRELLWQGEISLLDCRLGLFGENFGETAEFNFSTVQIFAP